MSWFPRMPKTRLTARGVAVTLSAAVLPAWASLSCGATSARGQYQPPQEGPRATITFDSKSITGLSSTSNSYLNYVVHTCLGESGRSYISVPPKQSKTVAVRAQEPIYLSLTSTAQGGAGTVYFSFTPSVGEEYGVVFTKLLGPSGAPSMKIEVSDSRQRPVPTNKGPKDWPRCEK